MSTKSQQSADLISSTETKFGAHRNTEKVRLIRSQTLVAANQKQLGGRYSRVLDIFFAAGLCLIFLPVIAGTCLVLLCSGGPVFFRQARLGHGGQLFSVYKFRTMVPNAADALNSILEQNQDLKKEWAANFKLKNDPRVTWIGRFLRRTSLDELPQLWNIIKGDMSLVGPRPIEPFEIAQYGRFAKHYYAQRPGLTGLWQVSGRSNASYHRRVVLDAFYSRNKNIILDLRIIIKTIWVVLKGHGAY
jgi:exopolysaccharide production protein ExoY